MGIAATLPLVPVLQTPRLRLRPLQAEDAEALHDAFADPQVMRHWSLAPSGDLAETRQRIAWSLAASLETHAAWAITRPPHDRLIGLVNYHHREAWNRRLEIGYLLVRRHWRQGLMREALFALLDHCIAALEAHRIEAMVEPSNLPSRRLLEGLGFACESGVLRDRIKVGDAYRSMVMYALLAPDWKAARRP